MAEGRHKGLHEAKYEMKRTVRGLRKRLDKKIPLFPEGEYVLMTRCKIMDHRTGTLSSHFELVGSGSLMDAAERQREYFINHCPADDDGDENKDDESTLADTYLIMPPSAIPRATKLREMLRLLWTLEGHSATKQIYNAVTKGEAGFSWWTTEFPDIPFTNKAVESSENSVRIYRVVAPKLYERLVGHPLPTEAPEEPVVPFVRCDRQHHVTGLQQCSLRKSHRGVCNMSYVAPVVREDAPPMEERQESQKTDPAEFYRVLRRIGHRKEPFLKFSAGDIKILGVHLKSGMNQLAAYRRMGLTIDRAYEKWFKKNNGAVVWEEIRRQFPDYLDDYVLDPQEDVLREVKKPKERVKKAKTTKRKTVNVVDRLKSTRQKNAFKRKQQILATAGYV